MKFWLGVGLGIAGIMLVALLAYWLTKWTSFNERLDSLELKYIQLDRLTDQILQADSLYKCTSGQIRNWISEEEFASGKCRPFYSRAL